METRPLEIQPRGRVEMVIWKLGGHTRLASVLGTRKQTVYEWQKRDRIPAKWQPKLMELAQANGIELKAEDLIG